MPRPPQEVQKGWSLHPMGPSRFNSPHDPAILRASKQASRRAALWRRGHLEIKNPERKKQWWAECGMWRSRHARAVVPSDSEGPPSKPNAR
jgi:hypothetical protein